MFTYPLPEYWFSIILTILFLIVTFLTSRGSLTDWRNKKKWWKKINVRGWWVIGINLFIVILLILQFINNKSLMTLKDQQLVNEQELRDSLIQVGVKRGVEDITDNLFAKLSLAFSKQGLKIDSLNLVISNIETANYTTNNIINEKEPFLLIETINSIETFPNQIRLKFKSAYAGSSNYKVFMSILITWSDGTMSFSKNDFIPSSILLPADKELDRAIININDEQKKVEKFYVFLYGNYSNLNKSKNYSIDRLYESRKDNNELWEIIGPIKDSILRIMPDVH